MTTRYNMRDSKNLQHKWIKISSIVLHSTLSNDYIDIGLIGIIPTSALLVLTKQI